MAVLVAAACVDAVTRTSDQFSQVHCGGHWAYFGPIGRSLPL
jgi:hypothetical protein